MDHLCYLCLVFVMLSSLYIAALWSPAGKGLTTWLFRVMFNCVFVTFPCGILAQVWYLIVSFPDLCCLSYFKTCMYQLFLSRKCHLLTISAAYVMYPNALQTNFIKDANMTNPDLDPYCFQYSRRECR